MPGYQWFGRGILTRTGGGDFQGAVASSSGITAQTGFVATAGGYDEPITASSSGVTLVAYGTHVISTAADATYILAAPTVGIPVNLVNIATSGSTATVVYGTSGLGTTSVLGASSSGNTNIRQVAIAGGGAVTLMGSSANLWTAVASRSILMSSAT